MNIGSDLSSKHLSIDHSSGRKVYPDEDLLETVGNLFPGADPVSYQVAGKEESLIYGTEPPIDDTEQEIQSRQEQSDVALSEDRMQDVDTGSNAVPNTDGLDVADININMPGPADFRKLSQGRINL